MPGILPSFLHLTLTIRCERGLLPSCTDEKTSIYRGKKILPKRGRTRIWILVGVIPERKFPPPCRTWLPAPSIATLFSHRSVYTGLPVTHMLPGLWASGHSVPSGRSVFPPSLHSKSYPSSNVSFLDLRKQTSYPFLRTPTTYCCLTRVIYTELSSSL